MGGLVTKSCASFASPWTLAHQAPLSIGFSRQEYWSGLPFSSPRDLPGSGRSPGEGNGNPLQYSCLENPIDRGAWRATVHGIARVGHNLAIKLPPESLRDLSKVTNV